MSYVTSTGTLGTGRLGGSTLGTGTLSSNIGGTSSAGKSDATKQKDKTKKKPADSKTQTDSTKKKGKAKDTDKAGKKGKSGKADDTKGTKGTSGKQQAKETGKQKVKTLTKNGWDDAKIKSTSKDGSSTVTATKDGVTYEINYDKDGKKTGKKIVGGTPQAIAEKKKGVLEKHGWTNLSVSDEGVLMGTNEKGETVSLTYHDNGTKSSKTITSGKEGDASYRMVYAEFDDGGNRQNRTVATGVKGTDSYRVASAEFNTATGLRTNRTITTGTEGTEGYTATRVEFNDAGAKTRREATSGIQGTDSYRLAVTTYQTDADGKNIIDKNGKPIKAEMQKTKGTEGTKSYEFVAVKYYDGTGIKQEQATIKGDKNDVRNYLESLNHYTENGILKDSTIAGAMQIPGAADDQYFTSQYYREYDTTNDKRQVLSESTKVDIGKGLEEVLTTSFTYDSEGRVATSKEVRSDNLSIGEDGTLACESITTTDSQFDYSSQDAAVMKTATVKVSIDRGDGTPEEHAYIETYIDNRDRAGNATQDNLVDHITREYTSEARYMLKSYTYGDGQIPTEVKIMDDTYSDEYATYADAKAAGAQPVLTAKTTATIDESTKDDMIGQTYNMNTIVTDGNGNFICEDNGVSMGDAHSWFNKTFDYQTKSAKEILDGMIASGASEEEIEAFLKSIGEMDGSSQGARQAEEYYRGIASGAVGGDTGAGDAGGDAAGAGDAGAAGTPTTGGTNTPAGSVTTPPASSVAPTPPASSVAPTTPASSAAPTTDTNKPTLSDEQKEAWKQLIDNIMNGSFSGNLRPSEVALHEQNMEFILAYINEKYPGQLEVRLTDMSQGFMDQGRQEEVGAYDLVFKKSTGEVFV